MNLTDLHTWAMRHRVSPDALAELHLVLGLDHDATPDQPMRMAHEGDVSRAARILVSRAGGRVWRNNVGAATTDSGSHIRFGLANESAQENKILKSSDLIGLSPVVVTPEMVGRTIGVFEAIETKAPGWRYTGTDREVAQLAFINLVLRLGGRARFWNGSSYEPRIL